MTDLPLLDLIEKLPPIKIYGETYNPDFDRDRLGKQQQRVFDVTCDQGWFTLAEIQARIIREFGVRDPEASISARLRSFKSDEYLASRFIMEHRREGETGLWKYRVMRK